MEKKSIILNLSSELIDKIDQLNTMDDRSDFISSLLEKQLDASLNNNIDETNELITKMSENQDFLGLSGEIDLINSQGISIGKFDIDTLEGFENLAKKIQEISKDPAVQIRAQSFF
ncbi:hypothetical protein AYK20_03320 [Thermoplasmatales archaeon SG8-52-1]|nr:MAG: hypothetical protein AYK20_03320 [Thermoplasmatales archaeon SG8-52-1]